MAPAFGEFLGQAAEHINAAVDFGGDLPDAAVRGIIGELDRLVTTLARYLNDVTRPADFYSTGNDPLNPETRAILDARLALRRAASSLHPAAPTEHGSAAGDAHPAVRHLSSAASHLAAGRDLLQTHFTYSPARRPMRTSIWAAAITSRPITVPLLNELGAYSQHLAIWTAQLSEAGSASSSLPAEACRALHAASWWLRTAAVNLQVAERLQPSAASGRRLLAAVPPNFPPSRRPPGDAEPIPVLCEGITVTAERLRHAAASFADQTRWSPVANSLSWRRDALAAAIVSHSAEVVLRTLTARATQLGLPAATRAQLRRAAETMSQTWPAWRAVARQWDTFSTGIHQKWEISPVAAEFEDLVLRTGRLAYHNPRWTPASAEASRARVPADLAARAGGVGAVVRAVQQATDVISYITTEDREAVRAAAADHRLYIPTRLLPDQYDVARRYSPAPSAQADELLGAYGTAIDASLRAVTALDELAVTIDAPDSALQAARSAASRRTSASQPIESDATPAQPQVRQPPYVPSPQPGPIERILGGLQISEPAMLLRAAALDDAARELLEHAAVTSHKHDNLKLQPRRRARRDADRPARTAAKDIPLAPGPDQPIDLKTKVTAAEPSPSRRQPAARRDSPRSSGSAR
jgi:hypothetical protein